VGGGSIWGTLLCDPCSLDSAVSAGYIVIKRKWHKQKVENKHQDVKFSLMCCWYISSSRLPSLPWVRKAPGVQFDPSSSPQKIRQLTTHSTPSFNTHVQNKEANAVFRTSCSTPSIQHARQTRGSPRWCDSSALARVIGNQDAGQPSWKVIIINDTSFGDDLQTKLCLWP